MCTTAVVEQTDLYCRRGIKEAHVGFSKSDERDTPNNGLPKRVHGCVRQTLVKRNVQALKLLQRLVWKRVRVSQHTQFNKGGLLQLASCHVHQAPLRHFL